MPVPLVTACPGCGKSIKYPAHAVGKSIRCRYCGTISKAPHPPEAPPAPKDDTVSHRAADGTHEEKRVPRRQSAGSPPLPAPMKAPPVQAPRVSSLPSPPADVPQIAPLVTLNSRRRRRHGFGWLIVIGAVGIILTCAAITVGVVAVIGLRVTSQENRDGGSTPATAGTPVHESQPLPHAVTSDFPRRILAIGVHNYIFANPTSYGADSTGLIRRDFGKTVEKIANRFRIPEGQVFELSDGAPEPRRRIPLKPVIEQTIQRFVETCRRQDRIILLLCAHTVEVEGTPYVVPLEGELTDPKTLIPLDWIMKQLGDCRAQQKILIADFNRYDRGRGVELPHGGKMAASTAKLLKNPPPGVQVWSACSEGQYSYEFDDYYEFRDGDRVQGIKGGAFLSLFSVAFMQGLGGKIQSPNDVLPIEALAAKVNELTERLSEEFADSEDDSADAPANPPPAPPSAEKPARRAKQIPFLAGNLPSETVTYDPTEPVPPAIVIPTPQDVFGERMASVEQVRRLVDFFALPPIKEPRKTDVRIRFDEILPFRAERLAEYHNGMTAEQVQKEASRYPVRAAVVRAIEEIRKLESGDGALPSILTEADRSDAAKAAFARMQRGPARVMHVLEQITEELDQAVARRDDEKSKFWQATLDYVRAQVKARHIYVNEYTNAFGIVRRDRLPELDSKKGHVGWRLASRETLSTNDSSMKELRKELRKIYDDIIKEHPDTPWAILAKREKNVALGLRWEPFARPKSEQMEGFADSR